MLPLAGIRVIEVAQNLAGPYCAAILAHLGADVIKVERPQGGDDTRGWGPPFLDGSGASFHAVNLGKRSVTVDLKDADAVARLLTLIDGADILVENLRPGSMDALGLDGPTLTRRNPKLIYCSLAALGSVGPLKNRPGFEPMVQAFSGLMTLSGEPGGPINSLPDVLAEPQTEAVGMLMQVPDFAQRLIGLPVMFDGARPPVSRRAPRLGEHNDEVWKDA